MKLPNFRNKIKNIWLIIKNSRVLLYIILLVVAFILLLVTKIVFNIKIISNVANLWSEMFGMMLDILFLGIFLTYMNNRNDRKELIQRYSEEIDDFRDWHADEAKYRILGNIKRLQKLGIHNYDLNHCYLSGVSISFLNLDATSFRYAEVNNASFSEVSLSGGNFNNSKMNMAYFSGCNLENSDFQMAVLKQASFLQCNLSNSSFISTICEECDFGEADISSVNFERAELKNARLSQTEGLVVEQLHKVKSLYNATLPEGMDDELKSKDNETYQLLINDIKRDPVGVALDKLLSKIKGE